jgi:CrcB protein
MAISFKLFLFVFMAGGIGATLRWISSFYANKISGKFWAGTLIVNLLGCLIFYMVSRYQPSNKELELVFKTGLLGSLTTFSTFSYEVVTLIKTGRPMEALLVFSLNIFLGIIIGIGIIR